MTIRIKLESNILDTKHKTAILSPDEINDHIVVKKLKSGKTMFCLPFRVDIIHSIKNDLVYELEILNDNTKRRISLVDPDLLTPTVKQLDKYSLLPGQPNFNIGDINKRIKKRNNDKEIKIDTLQSSKGFDKLNRSSPLKTFNFKGQFSSKFDSKSKILARPQMIIKNTEAKKSMIQNIHDGDHVIRNAVLINKSRTIKKRRIDYTKKISNRVVRRIKRSKSKNAAKRFLSFESKVLFGKPNNPGIDRSSLVFYPAPSISKNTMSKGGEKSINRNLSDNILSPGGSDKSKESSKSIKKSFLNQYQKRLDPAVLFEGVPTHRSALNVKRGTLPKLGIKKTGKKGKGLIFKKMNVSKSLRLNHFDKNLSLVNEIVKNKAIIRDGVGKKGTFELRKPTKREKLPFAYIEKVVKNYELVYYKYILDESHINSDQSVNMQLNIYNKLGLKVADKLFSIRPKIIIAEQSSVPDAMPTLNITKDKNKNFITVEIINSSKSSINYKLYRKFIDSSSTENLTNIFQQIDQGVVKSKGVIRKRINQVTNTDCLFRMTCQIRGSGNTTSFGNFSNEILIMKNESDIKKDVVLNTTVQNGKIKNKPGIRIDVSNIPPDVVSLRLLRRNVSLCKSMDSSNRMQKMEYVRDTRDITITQKIDIINQDVVSFFDNQVKDDNIYEYQAEMMLSRGTKKRSTMRVREEFIEKDNSVNTDRFKKLLQDGFVSIQDIFFNNEKRNIITPTVPGRGKIDVFKFETGRTQTQMIMQNLTNRSNKDLYTKELEEIKATTNIITGVNLVLKNLTNGDAFEVCDLNSGDGLATFIEQVKSNKQITMSNFCEYELIVKGYEIAPQEAVEKLTKLVKSSEESKFLIGKVNKNSAKKRAISTKLSMNKTKKGLKAGSRFITKKRSKFFEKRSMKRGTISPGIGVASTISKGKTLRGSPNIIPKNFTGDVSIIRFSNLMSDYCSMKPLNCYVTPSHNVVITFSISSRNMRGIDFIIITAEKDGDFFPVGSAHVSNENINTLSYLDYTNSDYLGRVKYYGQAVYLTGNVSARQEIGQVLLVKKFDESNV